MSTIQPVYLDSGSDYSADDEFVQMRHPGAKNDIIIEMDHLGGGRRTRTVKPLSSGGDKAERKSRCCDCTCGNFTKVGSVALIILGGIFGVATYFEAIDYKMGTIGMVGIIVVLGVWNCIMQVFPSLGEVTRKHAKLNRADERLLEREERAIANWKAIQKTERALNQEIGRLNQGLKILQEELAITKEQLAKSEAALKLVDETMKRLEKASDRYNEQHQIEEQALEAVEGELGEVKKQGDKLNAFIETELQQASAQNASLAEYLTQQAEAYSAVFRKVAGTQHLAAAHQHSKSQLVQQNEQLKEKCDNLEDQVDQIQQTVQEYEVLANEMKAVTEELRKDKDLLFGTVGDLIPYLGTIVSGTRIGREEAIKAVETALPKLKDAVSPRDLSGQTAAGISSSSSSSSTLID